MHVAVLWLALALTADAPASPLPLTIPKAVDPRLRVELFAADPDVATPTGLAVDARGRVLVVESHTHFRPEGYAGPAADRIRMLVDADGDGRAEQVTTFFEGTTWTMNLGIHPDGSVYVATRNEIFRLRETDDDGRADERTPIVRLETQGDYPHNGLSGFAFDFAGNVYFGLGENKGAEYKLIGTDGSVVSQMEGGQVFCCRADGTQLRMLSFGFWNPFHLGFDTFGRLFVVDNDPDALPPCRLIHNVAGGNYGYRYRNGRKGIHPFTAWNGELPGTLPMVAGTGEAPSGIVAYESDHLPADYVGQLLVTSWGDHRIERYRLDPRGASFRGIPATVISGDENFRPVGIAVAPDGSLFVSDWVLRDYSVHGKGRVWHITNPKAPPRAVPADDATALGSADRTIRENAARRMAADPDVGQHLLAQLADQSPSPRARALAITGLAHAGEWGAVQAVARHDVSVDVQTAALRLLADVDHLPDLLVPKWEYWPELLGPKAPAEVRAEALRLAWVPTGCEALWKAVEDPDAFVAAAARAGLAAADAVTPTMDWKSLSPRQRLACLLILRESQGAAAKAVLPKFLRDPDTDVRFAAIQWVGEERLAEYRQPLIEALSAGPATARLFGGYLAALERLDGVRRQASDEWGGENYIVRALEDPKTPDAVKQWCLRMLRPDHPLLSIARLQTYLSDNDAALQLEAIRTLRESPHAERAALLAAVAADERRPVELRAEAIVGLTNDDESTRDLLCRLAGSNEQELRDEALRSLRGCKLSDSQRTALAAVGKRDAAASALVARVLEPKQSAISPMPTDSAGWLRLLQTQDGKLGGNAAAGQRIFFHSKSVACGRCHQVLGRGAHVGPELTATAGSLSPQRLVDSIVNPSREIAPQFSTWLIVTSSGTSLTGMLVHELADGTQTYANPEGKLFVLKPGEVEMRRSQTHSIMPEGLAGQMTREEFRDLLAFLRSPALASP